METKTNFRDKIEEALTLATTQREYWTEQENSLQALLRNSSMISEVIPSGCPLAKVRVEEVIENTMEHMRDRWFDIGDIVSQFQFLGSKPPSRQTIRAAVKRFVKNGKLIIRQPGCRGRSTLYQAK